MQKRTFLKTLSGLALTAAASRASAAGTAAPASGKRIAFVYYSWSGNTASIARAVKAMTGADTFALETVEPYPKEYRPTTEIVKKELEQGIDRPVKPLPMDLSAYDVVILGTPTWWHHAAQPLQSWMKSQKFAGKLVLTCSSHGGGGLMHVREDFENLLAGSGAKLGTHLLVWGGVDDDDRKVRAWLRENGLL